MKLKAIIKIWIRNQYILADRLTQNRWDSATKFAAKKIFVTMPIFILRLALFPISLSLFIIGVKLLEEK